MKKPLKTILTQLCSGIIIFCSSSLFAQSDLSALSLAGTSDGPAAAGWAGDSQYVHKKVSKPKRKMASDENQNAVKPNASPAGGASTKSNEAGFTRLPPPEPTTSLTIINEGSSSQSLSSPTNPNFAAKVKEAMLGGDEELLQNYKSFLDDQDVRKNFFELSLSSGYMYNASTSSYYFKNYNNSGPTADLNADIWLSPFLGITGEYKTTLLNEVSDSPTQNIYVSATQSWFDLGLKFRRFFGMALNAPSLTLGLRYLQYQMSTPQSSLSRAKLTTQGPELDVDLALPIGKYSFWTMGLNLQPIDSLTEVSGAPIRAGQGNQTVGFGASMGVEYRFSRQTTAFLKISSEIYKSDFSGNASTVDPVTGSTPSSVPVTNVFYFLDLGIRLGH